MLRGNLATRPFYNDRAVTLAIAGVAALVTVLTIFNATELLSLTERRGAIQDRIERSRNEAARITAEAAALQQGIDRASLAQLAGSAREANVLIDERTFSWTALFGLLEQTMPMDVRLVSVSPRVDKGVMKVALDVVAREFADVSSFIDALGATGAFSDVAPTEQQGREDGTYSARIDGVYRPTEAHP
jgi:hypothetical protein